MSNCRDAKDRDDKFADMVVNGLHFYHKFSGSIMIYEESTRTYHPKGPVCEIVKHFSLDHRVFYCKLADCALVIYELCERSNLSELLAVHYSRAKAITKPLTGSMNEEIENCLRRLCMFGVNNVRSLSEDAKDAKDADVDVDVDGIEPEEIPF